MIARVATMLLALAIGGLLLAPREVSTQQQPQCEDVAGYRRALDAAQREITLLNMRKPVAAKRRAKA